MDRATRKANLKKLQLPGTGNKIQQRKTRQSVTTITGTDAISNYFVIPDKSLNEKDHKQITPSSPTNQVGVEEPKTATSKPNVTRAKRTKLDAFVFKTPHAIATELNTAPKATNDDEFDVPEKKAKKAPPISNTDNVQVKAKKASKRKKQTTIKSAFLRNEQLFAEIAAQHCAVDNFDSDDIQLAIAISKSEAQSKGIDLIGDSDLIDDGLEVANDDQKAEKIRQQLEKYGFRTAEEKDYKTFAAAFGPQAKVRRTKSKWANKFTALTLRDDQLQNNKLQQKIEILLNQQFRTKTLMAAEQVYSNFVFQSALLRKCDKEMKGKIVNLSGNLQLCNESYFIAELFEVSKLPPGHLLKDWNAIQGRDLTPKKCARNNDKELKLERIYADLDEHFKRLKAQSIINDSVTSEVQLSGQGKEDSDKIADNLKQIEQHANEVPTAEQDSIKSADILKHLETNDIFPKVFDTLTNGNTYNNEDNKGEIVSHVLNEDTTSVTDTSLTSSTCNKILQIIPPTTDLDLMQVSSSSLQVDRFIELKSKESQVTDLNRINIPCSSINVNDDNKFAESCHDKTPFSIITKATNKYKPFENDPDLMELSNYSLGIEDFNNAEEMAGETAPKHDTNPLLEVKNSNKSQTAFNSTQKDNLCNLNIMQVCSNSVNTQKTIDNTTQNNRSNSPDLFADSDVEMDDNDNTSEDTTSAITINAKKNKSFEGLTTYEIYSSDEVKNTASLVKPDSLTGLKQNDAVVIDLTLDDVKEKTQNDLNKSKSLVEVDLFADSPLQDESDKVIEINSNSQKSKYFKNSHENTSKFTLSPYKENVVSPAKHIEIILTPSVEDNDVNDCLDEGEDDVDDVVLREIVTNQTNTSFLNLEGSKQLLTCFHRETATEPKTANKTTKAVESAHKESFPGNETIFRELYSKYLGSSATQNGTSHKPNLSVLRKSFTQVSPRVITPNREGNGTQFTMDFNMTVELNVNNRKSLSFISKTPEKCRDMSDCKLSKSQSFSHEQNISIDLTQNDEDADVTAEDEDDDCLVLSDDEINYSIWNANKTGLLDERDVDADKKKGESINSVLPSNSSLMAILNNEISPPTKLLFSQQSYIDFDAKCSKSTKSLSCSRLENAFSKELPPMLKQFSPSQQTYSNFKSLEENMQLECSNVGMLDSFSEHVDFTSKMCTPPTKALEDVSFLDSPTENSAPMKRFSSCRKSAQQLNDLVNHLDVEAPMHNSWDEYEEFGFQIDHNQINKSTTTNLPQGLDQLLTAEITFEKPHDPSLNKKTNSSKISNTPSLKENPKITSGAVFEKQELTVNNKTYTIRHLASSSKPDYTLYSEPELLKELYNFGIKPLKRKQAVKMLEYLYVQTHPILVDDLITENPEDDCEILNDFDTASTSNSKTRNLLSTKGSTQLTSHNNLDTQSSIIPSFTKTPTEGNSKYCGLGKKLDLHDASGMEMLRYSLDLKTELVHEQYVLQTNVTKKTPQPLMPFHIAWFNLVCSNRNLHENILMYEPIDLQEIYLFLKGLGYRYDPKDLKQFFDRRCIIFRYDLAAAGGNNKVNGNNRHVRKKKSAGRKQAGPYKF